MPTEAELAATKAAEEAAAEAKKAEDLKAADEAKAKKKELSWEDWLKDQPEAVQENYEVHVKGLKSALASERTKGKNVTKLEKELKAFQDDAKAKKEAEMSDLEKLQAKYSDLEKTQSKLESQLADERLKRAITSESAKLKFSDPEDAFILLDLKQVEQDDDGNYENIEDLLKELAKAKPYLINDGSGGHGTPPKDKLKKKSEKITAAKPKIKF